MIPSPGCDTPAWSNPATPIPVSTSTTWSTDRRTDARVDSFALIAFLDVSDSHHALFRGLFSNPPRALISSSLVVTEGHAWFLKRYDRGRALQFLSMLEDMSFLTLVGVGTDEIEAGIRIIRRFGDQKLTLVDAIGLHLMESLGSKVCWSTDRHLGLTGVPLVIHGR